jgi:hypothetical protein
MTSTNGLVTELDPATGTTLRSVLPEWRALWARAADREPFCHPDWVLAHVAALEPGATGVLVTARSQGRFVAVLPLLGETNVLDGMQGRLLRTPMNPHFYRVHVLREAADGAVTPRVICNGIASHRGWDYLAIPRFARAGFVDDLAEHAGERGFPTLLRPEQPTRHVPLPDRSVLGVGSPWLATGRPNLLNELRRASRRIREDFGGELILERHEAASPAR